MWQNINGHLVHATDKSRVMFKTTISYEILEHLKSLAKEHDTYVNYLLENGIKKVIENDFIQYNKALRPKDRVQYKSMYNNELLDALRKFAVEHNLFINDVIEYSTKFIDPEIVPKKDFRNRIEFKTN